jgi:hypothetical protein
VQRFFNLDLEDVFLRDDDMGVKDQQPFLFVIAQHGSADRFVLVAEVDFYRCFVQHEILKQRSIHPLPEFRSGSAIRSSYPFDSIREISFRLPENSRCCGSRQINVSPAMTADSTARSAVIGRFERAAWPFDIGEIRLDLACILKPVVTLHRCRRFAAPCRSQRKAVQRGGFGREQAGAALGVSTNAGAAQQSVLKANASSPRPE